MNIPIDPRGGDWSFAPYPDEYAPCPTCDGAGAVLSDRPGVLVGCPTCHGAGIVPVALLTAEQTSVAPATDAGRQALAADRARGAGAGT